MIRGAPAVGLLVLAALFGLYAWAEEARRDRVVEGIWQVQAQPFCSARQTRLEAHIAAVEAELGHLTFDGESGLSPGADVAVIMHFGGLDKTTHAPRPDAHFRYAPGESPAVTPLDAPAKSLAARLCAATENALAPSRE